MQDADGYLIQNGRWPRTCTMENRSITIESRSTLPADVRYREEWTYLPDGRWIERIVSKWNGSAYAPQLTNRYVWDDKLLLAVLDHTNGVVMSFMRGLDLSGTEQGAGGAGNILAITFATNGTHFASFDGNGNLVTLTDSASATNSAAYEYGPFGETTRMEGPPAQSNPIRFSTQYADDATGDLKYLFRDYRPDIGRWTSRDPLQQAEGEGAQASSGDLEASEKSDMAFSKNAPTWLIDAWGLSVPPGAPPPRDPPVKGHTVLLSRCSVVILFGHGNKNIHWKWNQSKSGCSAGASVVCWPGLQISGLSDNLWPEAEQITEEPIWWIPDQIDPFRSPDVPRNRNKMILAPPSLRMVMTNAVRAVVQFCNPPCCCKNVDLHFVRVDKNGNALPPGAPNTSGDGVPTGHSARFDCKTRRFVQLN